MTDDIIERIESLPPLPQTIIEIEEFRKDPDKELFDLVKIIEKDALIVSTLLKITNSAMFGFRSKVETTSKAIHLLGTNFTISVAIGGTIQNLLKTNLSPYDINSEDFMRASSLATTFATYWLSKVSFELKEELVMPALLQEAGKFILADLIISLDKEKEFKDLIISGKKIYEAEKEIVGLSTSEITAKIFSHWKLSEKLIKVIENVDSISKCEEKYLKKTQMLDIIRTVCCVSAPLSEKNIEEALIKAKKYSLDTKYIKAAIVKLQDKLLDE